MTDRIRILCVDDEPNVLKAVKRVLADDGYELHTAASGAEGLARLLDLSPVQVVISDYRMPEMNGVEFLRDVNRHWPDTVRMVLSGYADTGAVVAAVNEGHIYKFIAKPWNDDELRIAVANAAERWDLQQRAARLSRELDGKNDELRKANTALEWLISEKTAELMLQNRTSAMAQRILQALPAAVLGLSADGIVIVCNRRCRALLEKDGGAAILGRGREDALSRELNDFMDAVITQRDHSDSILVNGRRVHARGLCVGMEYGEEGVVAVLDIGAAAPGMEGQDHE